MGKPAAFVCAIALGIILIASGDTGDEDALLKPNVTTESTSVEENASQKTTVKNGNNLAEESTYPDNETPEETKSNEKPQQKGDCGKGEESKSSDIDDPVGTKGKGKSRQQPQQKGNCEEGNQKDLNSDGGTKMKNSTRKGRNKQDRNEDKLTENASVNDTSFELVTTAQLPGEMFESYTNSNSSVCASPPEIEGAVNPEIEGMNHPPGTSVTYSCPLGYVSRNTINHISFCRINEATRRAEWTVPEINCSPRSCGDPGYVNNGRRIGNLFTFPNKVEYECEEGYKLRGLNSRYCQAGGEWSGRLPTCEQIYCNIPEDPINGRVTYSSLEYGTELNYECNVGFLVTEHQRRICSENGIWSNEKPECIEAICEEPQPLKYGTVKLHGDLKVGSLATYSCEPGRRLYGATTTKCLISGKWTFAAPECLSSCKVPFIENGEMGRYETRHGRWSSHQEFKKVLSGENVNSGETMTLKCKSGYWPIENSEFLKNSIAEVTCGDGKWSKDLQCKQKYCDGEPPPSKNARSVVASREHGDTIWYQCTGRPYVKIPGNVTCHLGSWKGIPPRCLSQPCYRRDLNYPGLIKPAEKNFDSFESFQINCEIGYRKRPGLQNITCACGKWEISQSPCIQENTVISFDEDLKILPDGIVSVQKHEKRLFVCSNAWKQPEWDYGQRKNVFITNPKVLGSKCTQFFSFMYILGVEDDHSGRYECFMRDDNDQRVGSTFLSLKVDGPESLCPELPDDNSIVIKYEMGRRENSKVSFSCPKEGQVLIGKAELTCLGSGEWSDPPPHCSGSDLLCPEFPEDNSIVIKYEMGRRENSKVSFSCPKEGQELIGKAELTCLRSGEWSDSPPHCSSSDLLCPEFPEDNSIVIKYEMGRRENSKVSFSCPKEGQELIGKAELTCLRSGKWSDSPPHCSSSDKLCPKFPEDNTIVIKYEMGRREISKVSFSCPKEGQKLIGKAELTCLRSGEWSDPAPRCSSIGGCVLNLDPESDLLAEPIEESYSVGDSVLLSCPRGKKLSEAVERLMCLGDVWSDTLPSCIKEK